MKYNKPHRINFPVSEISFGSWQLGNNIDFNFGDELAAFELVNAALKGGITLFDTAPNYGHGNSEKLLGETLKGNRKKFLLILSLDMIVKEERIFLLIDWKNQLEDLSKGYKQVIWIV